MEAFGIIGMSMGTVAFVFALNLMARVGKLEKQLTAAPQGCDDSNL